MAREPWFKFWAADYLTDADVAKVPPEGRELIVRMWCVCNLRGGCPSDIEDLAIATGLRISYVREWLPFLLSQNPSENPSKKVSKPLFDLLDGMYISPRMEREKAKSERARENAQNRVNKDSSGKTPAKSQANGSSKTPTQKAREPEDNPVYIYGGPALNSLTDFELLILDLIRAVPKGRHFESFESIPYADRSEAILAIKNLSRARKICEQQAYQYILEKTQQYSAVVAAWGPESFGYSSAIYEWFHESRFNREPHEWELPNGKRPGYQAGGSNGNATVTRTRNNVSAAVTAIQIGRQQRSEMGGDHRSDDAARGASVGNA